MASIYDTIDDGGCVEIDHRKEGQIWACCDCGLVHYQEYYIEGKILKVYTWREEKATAANRRYGTPSLMNGAHKLWKLVRRRNGACN